MRLTTKFSAFFTLSIGLAIFVTLIGSSLSFYHSIQYKVENRVQSVATIIDTHLVTTSFDRLALQLDELMVPMDIVRVQVMLGEETLFRRERLDMYRPSGSTSKYRELTVTSVKYPRMRFLLQYRDPIASNFRSFITTAPLTLSIAFMVLAIFLAVRWLRRQLSGQELLELRAIRILNGERGHQVRGSVYEWPTRTSSALDMLLSEIQFASDQRSRIDTLIRSHAALDTRTGLSNRIFFDNQLATLLEDQEKVGLMASS